MKKFLRVVLYLVPLLLLAKIVYVLFIEPEGQSSLILSSELYHDEGAPLFTQLAHRVSVQPFNLFSFLIFFFAIVHTLFANKFTEAAERLVAARRKHLKKRKEALETVLIEVLRFLGEIEIVFGIWLIPLLLCMDLFYGVNTVKGYLNHLDYIEPLYVVVTMTVASSAPIIRFVENLLSKLVRLAGGSLSIWWFSLLTLVPLVGSLIKEPGAMTLAALLLGKEFFRYRPSKALAHATLGLLFTNISIGGTLTNFAALPIIMIADKWGWDSSFMFKHFGWKAILGILISNFAYYAVFRSEFWALEQKKREEKEIRKVSHFPIPLWVTLINIIFLSLIIINNRTPVIFIGLLLFYLGFAKATAIYHKEINLKTPLLVGFFLAALVVHGSLQGWWISPILQDFSHESLLAFSTLLSAFNDNATVAFLASLVPSFDDSHKYLIIAGAMSAGGLTIIANTPNPAGQVLLEKHFHHKIQPSRLFLAALFPMFVNTLCFYLLT